MGKQSIGDVQRLLDGYEMPKFGLGVYKATQEEVSKAICYAVEYGYRHIDTASMYHNEEGVGQGIRQCGLPREKLFVVTKIWMDRYGDAATALDESLGRLKCDYLDLYLLHWPGVDVNLRHKAWDTLLNMRAKGKIKSCGVSNFMPDQLEELKEYSGEYPVNNQIEIHPWNQKRKLRKFCNEKNISITAWGPLFHGHLAEEPLMEELGRKYGKSAAQVTLRWHVQQGHIVIPKSAKRERILSNSQVFDFEIAEEDMAKINALNGKDTFCWDPEKFDGDLDEARKKREMIGTDV